VATVVTWLEMHSPVMRPDVAQFTLARVERPDVAWYRDLFRRVGAEDWMWFSRLAMDEAALAGILSDPDDHVYVLRHEGRDEGLLELDFREAGACELAFFGVTRAMMGMGAGRWLMNRAVEKAFGAGIGRFHLHTCTLDSPQALDFYRRSGFEPVRQQVEVLRDPRLTGLLAETAAGHVPIFR
jgi:GNAT superfamily N-acetyltransferase